jgi:CRISPR-associated protein Cmr6
MAKPLDLTSQPHASWHRHEYDPERGGPKTAAGYGLFEADTASVATLNQVEASFELKLVTPAFLAGAAQKQQDCDLRGATLRGQLRWWWRTLHAAHLEPTTLRRLEAAVWGASSEGSAVQIRLMAGAGPSAEQFNYNSDRNAPFIKNNAIGPSSDSVAESERRKTTQGLYYAAYGAGKETKKDGRFFRLPGSTWHLRIGARRSAYRAAVDADVQRLIPPGDVLRQAEAALFLLTRYGSVGAKGRKGFGSFEDIALGELASIADCKRVASDFRRLCGLPAVASAPREDAPSQELMSEPIIIQTKWTNAWFALNRIGEAMQAYAKTGKHQTWKSVLGLPRKSDSQEACNGYLQPQVTKQRISQHLKDGRIERHAAPIHFHVAGSDGALTVRLVTFVSPHLPDRQISADRLGKLRDHVRQFLQVHANQGGTAAMFPKTQVAEHIPDDGKPRVGRRIQAELLAERTKNCGWRARDLASGVERSIQNTHMVPKDKKAGDIVELEVPNNSEFKWLVSRPPAQRPAAPSRGGPQQRR